VKCELTLAGAFIFFIVYYLDRSFSWLVGPMCAVVHCTVGSNETLAWFYIIEHLHATFDVVNAALGSTTAARQNWSTREIKNSDLTSYRVQPISARQLYRWLL